MQKIKIELSTEEFNALQQLLDAGLRSSGMPAVRAAAHLLGIFEDAVKAAQSQQTGDE